MYQPYAAPKNDDRPIVEFYADAKEDLAASKKAGVPQFVDLEMIKIRFPADRNRTLVRPAHAEWKKERGNIVTYAMRFPEEYKRFKAGQAPVVRGMPLSEATFLTEAQRRMLRALEVYTVEQLSSLEGVPLKNLGQNGRQLQQAAAAFLDTARGTADTVRLASENEQLRHDMELLRQQVAQFGKQASPAPQASSAFDAWEDELLKEFIAEKTGAKPRGNPSHATLVQMAEELSKEAA